MMRIAGEGGNTRTIVQNYFWLPVTTLGQKFMVKISKSKSLQSTDTNGVGTYYKMFN